MLMDGCVNWNVVRRWCRGGAGGRSPLLSRPPVRPCSPIPGLPLLLLASFSCFSPCLTFFSPGPLLSLSIYFQNVVLPALLALSSCSPPVLSLLALSACSLPLLSPLALSRLSPVSRPSLSPLSLPALSPSLQRRNVLRRDTQRIGASRSRSGEAATVPVPHRAGPASGVAARTPMHEAALPEEQRLMLWMRQGSEGKQRAWSTTPTSRAEARSAPGPPPPTAAMARASRWRPSAPSTRVVT